MSADRFEIQLGHLCNNRCVFCVSGQLTSKRQAPLLDPALLKQRITEARGSGHRSLTLLGGEPTVQPFFLDVVRHAVALEFDTIVLFTNGSRLWRPEVIDAVLATGGRFEFRFSFQGATKEAHERTTRRKGSWDQLVGSLDAVRARGQRATVNMCVVRTNFESVERFAELLLPRGVSQLHVDMLNPYDTGVMSDEELSSIMPRLSDLAGPLERMVRAFPEGFDVNVGNLPFCVAPSIAPFVHHGGETTFTVTADDFGAEALQPERDKYAVKRAGKVKPERCRTCVFDDRCSGVFEAYAERHGLDELQPITVERLVQSRGALRPSITARVAHLRARQPFGALAWTTTHVLDRGRRVEIGFVHGDERAVVWFEDEGARVSSGYRVTPEGGKPSNEMIEGLRAIVAALGRGPSAGAVVDASQPR
jgi:MoaA/NifB/PqqE/SkfB family radical SAM enzyme